MSISVSRNLMIYYCEEFFAAENFHPLVVEMADGGGEQMWTTFIISTFLLTYERCYLSQKQIQWACLIGCSCQAFLIVGHFTEFKDHHTWWISEGVQTATLSAFVTVVHAKHFNSCNPKHYESLGCFFPVVGHDKCLTNKTPLQYQGWSVLFVFKRHQAPFILRNKSANKRQCRVSIRLGNWIITGHSAQAQWLQKRFSKCQRPIEMNCTAPK